MKLLHNEQIFGMKVELLADDKDPTVDDMHHGIYVRMVGKDETMWDQVHPVNMIQDKLTRMLEEEYQKTCK